MRTVGVILAGGQGTRLKPMTSYINKHLLHIYNKPMINHSISVMKSARIKDIYLICNPDDEEIFKNYFDTLNLKLNIKFVIQNKPDGIVGGLKLVEEFIKKKTKILLLLGDNIFIGQGLYQNYIQPALKSKNSCSFFSIYSSEPKKFGTIKYNGTTPSKIIEKPKKFVSNNIVTGMYVLDSSCFNIIKKIKLSKFNQYEITDVLNVYIKNKNFNYFKFGDGFAWLDCGEPDSLYKASEIVKFYYDLFKINLGKI